MTKRLYKQSLIEITMLARYAKAVAKRRSKDTRDKWSLSFTILEQIEEKLDELTDLIGGTDE